MSENSNNKERISEKLSSEKANTKKKGILPVIIGIAAVIIVIVGVVIFTQGSSKSKDTSSKQRNIVVNPDNVDEVKKDLDKQKVETGTYEVTMNTTWEFEKGDSASLTGSLKGVNKDLFETKYNASLPGNYEFVLKDDEKAKIDTDDGTNFPRVTFGLKGAANATDGVDWSTVDTTSTQPTVDVKWTLTDGNITGPSVQTTATFTKGTALEIPVTLGNGDTAATKATVTYSSTENGTYKAYANLFSYAKGKITVSSSACGSVASGTVVYLKVAFNDTAKTTQVIQLTVQE